MTILRTIGLTAAASALCLGIAAPAVAATTTPTHRGDVLSATHLRDLTSTQVKAELKPAGFDPAQSRDGVRLYRLTYRTVGTTGRPTTASGLVVLPSEHSARPLKIVSYAHGSEVYRGDAPSVTDDRWTTAPPVSFASAGFAAVAPDYLGLGTSPGPHPYLDVPSETTASVDLLRAAERFAPTVGTKLTSDVFVTGFSQGASAATGLARDLPSEFHLAALAPISGAYDLRHAELPAMLAGTLHPQWSTAYLAYLLISWNRLHGLYDSPAEVFRAPYDTTLPPLFDNEHPGEQLLAALPKNPKALLTDKGMRMIQHPTGAFAAALRVSDSTCENWTPDAPVRLYATRTDEQAAFANTLACGHDLHAPVVEVGPTDHLSSVARATPLIVTWFRRL